MRRSITLGFLALAALSGLATVAIAQEDTFLDGKIRAADTISIPAGETVEGDLYLFGGDINVAGSVTGDLVVFGGQVDISGDVGGDVLAAAGTLDVAGTISGDLRVGAGQFRAPGSIGEDILAGVGQLTISGDVGEDIVFGAGTVNLSGEIAGDVFGESGTYTRTGTVGGTEDVTVGELTPVEKPSIFVRALTRFASLFIIGLGLLGLARRTFERAVDRIKAAPGMVALWGLVFLFGLVIVPVAVTVIGVLLAILFGWLELGLVVGVVAVAVAFTWVFVALVGFVVIAVLAPIVVGTWLASLLLPEETPAYLAMAAGLAGLVIVGLIPVVNVLVGIAVTIMGAGAWLRSLRQGRSAQNDTESV